jgi:NAD(P)-dependent dehydrogenase (short-subunit alcohol dehydrogenase family)
VSVRQMFELGGRVALVTGGSRGLGLQIAKALGEMGAKIAITARKQAELDTAVAELAVAGIEAKAWACDIGKREAIAPAAEAILAHYGNIDILVNNAGANWAAPAETLPLDAWDKLVAVNLSGAFVLAQIVANRSMIPAKWGRIINVASVNGLQANDPRIVKVAGYVATKHGLVGLTRQLAAEWGVHGITVNAICPGFFVTRMTRTMLDSTGQLVLEATPTQRLGGDEDLKGLAVLLASEASRHITGQAIAVDGGASVV